MSIVPSLRGRKGVPYKCTFLPWLLGSMPLPIANVMGVVIAKRSFGLY